MVNRARSATLFSRYPEPKRALGRQGRGKGLNEGQPAASGFGRERGGTAAGIIAHLPTMGVKLSRPATTDCARLPVVRHRLCGGVTAAVPWSSIGGCGKWKWP